MQTLDHCLELGAGIPTLTMFAGVDLRYAMGASLVSVIATSSGVAATYVRDRMVNLRLAMFLELATTGAVVDALLAGLLFVALLSLQLLRPRARALHRTIKLAMLRPCLLRTG